MASYTLPVTFEGEGEETLLFIHGWPDTQQVWEHQVAHFKQNYRCMLITMPYFAGRSQEGDVGARKGGYSFMDAAKLLREVITSHNDGPVTLVIHDWGCYWGFTLQMMHPELVSRIVAMDVGHPSVIKSRCGSVLAFTVVGFVYQWWLALAYMVSRFLPGGIGKPLGDVIVRFILRAVMFSSYRHPHKEEIVKRANADMGYPYYYVYQIVYGGALGCSPKYRKLLKGKGPFPSCPCLFFYGKKKPVNFHSPAFEKELKSRDRCDAIGVDAGHWVQLEVPEEINQRMEAWLQSFST